MTIKNMLQSIASLVEERKIIDHGSIRCIRSEDDIRAITQCEGIDVGEADNRITLELARAGKLLKIEVLDHVIICRDLLPGMTRRWVSLRERGLFSALS